MPYTRDEIVSHLEALSDELQRRDIRGEIFLVGGAAMALAYNRKRTTKDIDAVFEPKMVVYDAAEHVAIARHLEPNWLNDAVKGFMPGPDPQAQTILNLPGLSVSVASPRYLFALKALASREDRDIDDLKTLYRLCGFSSVDEAIEHVETVFRGRPIEARVAYVLRESLGNDEGEHFRRGRHP
jgi:predicted nucleotidyltransferase